VTTQKASEKQKQLISNNTNFDNSPAAGQFRIEAAPVLTHTHTAQKYPLIMFNNSQ
jgi:hypothetical protein